MKKLTLAVIGCGNFAQKLVPLYKAHPYVEKVYVCDIIPEKAQSYSERFGLEIIPTFEEALKRSDINAVAIFTQRHLHGPMVISALKHGKHVYSAVPMASEVEECMEIVELVKETGLTYMMGETCYYYPSAMFAREAYEQGKIGDFIYGAAQYYHHIDSISYGKRPAERGMPPLLYPTHSTGMILSAVNSYVKKVTCFGYEGKDACFGVGNNVWDNPFTDEITLMKLANGGIARVTEGRTFAWKNPSSFVSAVYGTKGSYEFSNAQHILVEKDFSAEKESVILTDVSSYVNPEEMVKHEQEESFKNSVANGEWQWDKFSEIQAKEVARLPESFLDQPNGHMGSHKFLIDDFCTAAYFGKHPAVNAWNAARYTIPGLIAHQSALRDGESMDVPDCGEALT